MLPNIFLADTSISHPYERPGGGGGEAKRPDRDRQAHAAKLVRELDASLDQDDEETELRGGTYLRFNSSPRYALDPESFENRTQKIVLLRLDTDEDSGRTSATVFVPRGKEGFFRQKVTDYADETQETKKRPSSDGRGHGTGMAGIALFNDLKSALLDTGPVTLGHAIESVRIFPPSGANERSMYGVVTRDAVSEIEIAQPGSHRVFCMAVTDDGGITDGSPTSWSVEDAQVAWKTHGFGQVSLPPSVYSMPYFTNSMTG